MLVDQFLECVVIFVCIPDWIRILANVDLLVSNCQYLKCAVGVRCVTAGEDVAEIENS